ncbi:hypothetical protein BXY51_008858 [Actinoplanes cyaneus]|nr:hypothetical protein [Actinoplanes cyaneus]
MAASGSKGMQVGDGNTQTNTFNYHGAPPAVSWPHQVGVVPPRAASYQSRTEAAHLAAALKAGRTAVLTQILSGLGGIGKTQLAADLARQSLHDGRVDLLVWAVATSPEAVIARYAQADTDLHGREDSDPRRGADRFLAWLATTDRRWLVVLDDLAVMSSQVVQPGDGCQLADGGVGPVVVVVVQECR